MKSQSSLLQASVPLVAAFVLLLSACAKEDGFAPCEENAAGASGDAKSMLVGSTMGNAQSIGKPLPTGGKHDGSAISDDGDDVGDGERSRKKKPTS